MTKKNYFAFCDPDIMQIAEKTYVVKFLMNKKNQKIYENLEVLACELYLSLRQLYKDFNMEKLCEPFSLLISSKPFDELKNRFVKHCIENNASCKPSEGLKAMGYVFISMIKDEDCSKILEMNKNNE